MKILYVTTISNTVNAFLIPHIKMLIEKGHIVDVAFNIEQEVNEEIRDMGCKVYILPFQRSSFKKDNYKAYKIIKKIFRTQYYDLVHTHTPIASAIVRIACREAKNIKVLYTAHGFHFFKSAPLKNWILYYPIEKWLSKYTDVLITINKEDFERASKLFKAKRVEYVPGVGLDIKKFSKVQKDRLKMRKELGFTEKDFIVLSIGEINKNKNHEAVIKAIAKMNNPNINYIICGVGPLEVYIRRLIKKLQIEKQVHLLGFRRDIVEICNGSDVFAFPSKREGLPVSLMEAMATGIPVVCSNIRGNVDLIEDKKGGYLVETDDIDGYVTLLNKLIRNNSLRERMGKYNKEIIMKYDIDNVKKYIKKIYLGV